MPYTDEQRAEALAVYAEQGLAAAAKHSGADKSTIKGWADKADPPVVPPQRGTEKTAAATKARQEQMDEAKFALAEGLMSDIARIRDQMFAPCVERKVVTVAGSVKVEGRWEIVDIDRDKPTFTEQKSIMTTIAIAVDKVQVLTGGATQRTEHRYESGVDAEIRELTNALGSNDAPVKV